MKKLLLASAVAALSVTAAQAAPTIYGKAFLTVDFNSVDAEDANGNEVSSDSKSALNSNSSRIGFKGSEALTANTDLLYQLEYGVDVDSDKNGKGQFYSRDTYMGLSNAQYGTLLAGKLTTIDDMVDYADVLEGSNIAGNVGPTFNEPRANNAFAYVSPNYNGMTLMAMYGFDSDQDSGSLDNEDQYGIGAKYSTGPMNVGATYIGHGDDNHIRVSGNYTVNPAITVGALYQISEFGTDGKLSPFDNEDGPVGDKKENSLIVSAEMKTATPWTAYAQVNMVDNVKGIDNNEAMGVGVGGKYAFNKATTGHIYGGYLNKEEGEGSSKVETDGFGIGGGIEYKF